MRREKLEYNKNMITLLRQNALRIAWVIALAATIGSLYFSEVAGYAPCILCWYQRITMYPLVVFLLVAIVRKDQNIAAYVLPFTIIGGLISVYHNLLYYNVLEESEASCRFGVSCTTKFIEWFGFVTIPLLSLLAFAAITGFVLLARKFPQK